MIYRYKLKPTDENLKLKSRVINGVKLTVDDWVRSDTALSFVGFENSILAERSKNSGDFDKTRHVAKRVVEEPAVVTQVIAPRIKRQYIKKIDSGIKFYEEDELYAHLVEAGFTESELHDLTRIQLYELALINSELQGDGYVG